MATPAKRTRTVQPLEPEAMAQFIEQLQAQFDNILKAALVIGGGEKVGGTYGKKDLGRNATEFKRELKNVSKLYAAIAKQRRKPRAGGARRGGQGFQNPIMVTDTIRQF